MPYLTLLPFGECAQVSRDAPGALPGAAADQEEVAVVGERTFAQRDAECRKRAIDLEAETPQAGQGCVGCPGGARRQRAVRLHRSGRQARAGAGTICMG